jgi:hypothetical protein
MLPKPEDPVNVYVTKNAVNTGFYAGLRRFVAGDGVRL